MQTSNQITKTQNNKHAYKTQKQTIKIQSHPKHKLKPATKTIPIKIKTINKINNHN